MYHKAIRTSLFAFRTTTTNNLFIESGLPTLEKHIQNVNTSLIPKVLFLNTSIISEDVKKLVLSKRTFNVTPSLLRIIKLCNKYNLEVKPHRLRSYNPPWTLDSQCCDITLYTHKKDNTPNSIFKQIFLEKANTYNKSGWQIIFTDGSKTQNSVAFSITSETGSCISMKSMFPFSSVFSAEAAAIHEAIVFSLHKKTKTVICSDSLSVLQAVRNPICNNWETINQIRDMLIKNKKTLKLLWVPGHAEIDGNTYADEAAKFARNAPIIRTPKIEKLDIKRHIKTLIIHETRQLRSSHKHYHYTNINKDGTPPQYPTNIHGFKTRIFSRLRLGHTTQTHEYILKKENQPICITCNTLQTLDHILNNCQKFYNTKKAIFNTENINDVLATPSFANIEKIGKFIKDIEMTI
ncbi:uncharacterized protein LOC118735286 [Rhagoletis pomonella]|uniref:uncharacterized protein LOC118735286 n=1 Tax=Rhagoletis pomonella TaxID=28610 RepID=UPI00177E806A|nr:uncharacterized protein LOC118735286 [Rhagoletis pomonella]